jgi:hypothetical protein
MVQARTRIMNQLQAVALNEGIRKVFASLGNWLQEFRLYARDKDGKVIKANDDHLMDATRYLIVSGLSRMQAKPADDPVSWGAFYNMHPDKWMSN